MSRCSIVMVSYHTGGVLMPAIHAALDQEGLAELIVVDNGNPDEVVSELTNLKSRDARFQVLTGHGNVGFARGCNLGAQIASGDYLLLLNPDCLLPPHALVRFMEALKSYPDAALAGPNITNADGTPQRGARRQLLTPETALAEGLGLHRVSPAKRLNEHEAPVPAGIQEIPAISGACMFITRGEYHRLGGLDEGYFLHVEDLDFCYRIQQSGRKIIFVPHIRVVHALSTSDAPSAFIERCKARGFSRYFTKHFKNSIPLSTFALLHACILARLTLRLIKGYFKPSKPYDTKPVKRVLLLHRKMMEPDKPVADIAGKTVVVIGATSQIGLFLVARLLKAGAAVLAVKHEKEVPFEHSNLRWIHGELTRGELELDNYMADIAIYCASLWLVKDSLHALEKAGVKRLVAFGSTSMFTKSTSKNDGEQKVVEKLLRAESELPEACATHNIEWTILRPTMIYGAGLDGNVVSIARSITRHGRFPILPPASGLRQPVHADDLAACAINAAISHRARNRTYNISGGETLTYRELVARVFTTLGRTPRFLEIRFLPFLLDVLGQVRQKSGVNGDMARRMNEDLVFFHDEAMRDMRYHPRAFLSGGITDIEGYVP